MAMDGGGPGGAVRQQAIAPQDEGPALYVSPVAPAKRPGRAPDILDTFCPADGSAMAVMALVLAACGETEERMGR
jgi:hypothetical protein